MTRTNFDLLKLERLTVDKNDIIENALIDIDTTSENNMVLPSAHTMRMPSWENLLVDGDIPNPTSLVLD